MPKNPHANFRPTLESYSGQGAFRFWCQMALPLTYDDSLSYYELLNKVVTYLNNTIEDVGKVEDNVAALNEAYGKLEDYVNTYFDEIDIEAELRNVLDAMAEDGSLDSLLDPLVAERLGGVVAEQIDAVVANQIDDVVGEQIDDAVLENLPAVVPRAVSDWLEENITPTTPVVDNTLTISGAAADAKVTGDKITDLKNNLNYMLEGQKSISASDIIQGSYNSTGGVVENANRIRTKGFIDVKKGEKMTFTPGTNVHEIFVGYFSTSGSFIRDGNWTSSLSMTFDSDYKIILVFRRENNTQAITPTDYDASTIFYTKQNEINDEVITATNELCNIDLEWVTSGFIKPDGTIQGYTNFSCTDYIYISGNMHISGNFYFVHTGYYFIGFYDINKNFISTALPGDAGQHVIDQDLEAPEGAKYIRIADYTPQRDSVTLTMYTDVNTSAKIASQASKKIDDAVNSYSLANNLVAIKTQGSTEWTLEADDTSAVYVKAYPSLVVRGTNISAQTYTIQWSDVVSQLSSYVATSPSGVTNCIKLTDQTLCLDIANKRLAIIATGSAFKMPDYIPLVMGWGTNIIGGQIISGAIVWKNTKQISELQSKLADTAYISDNIKATLRTVNDTATYNYPNMPKILWISDVHWNNDCYAYLKYLTDFGQYDALIISGDLNYYQNEQTLEATKTGMSELARIWNNYYRGKTIILPCRGNHDGHLGNSDYTNEMFANAVIKPFHDCEPNGYYYYDLNKYNLRIIVLNSCDDAQDRKGFTSAEVTWFQNTLASVQDGWSVISVSHHPIVQDINNETTLAGNSAAIVSAIQSFMSTKPNCHFIAHLSGHTHVDAMEKVNNVEYVSLIDSSTDHSNYSADIICINQTTQTVNLLRSGQGSNRQFTY